MSKPKHIATIADLIGTLQLAAESADLVAPVYIMIGDEVYSLCLQVFPRGAMGLGSVLLTVDDRGRRLG